jgi:hypothetical protein
MLRLVSPDARKALAKAVRARRKAQSATDDSSRTFWTGQEAKWLRIAEMHGFIERLNTFLAFSKNRIK